ncbi:1-deoxy-D-xylulose 5-phosphate reductoisomerase [Clostridia bacterium]|nr:1-deoxy-D-xylulose 5-phosphate reductoisomerase [Clostridia bacterium]
MKKITIFGSTGSIGTQTLEIVRSQSDFKLIGLAAKKNIDLLEKQVREFHPKLVAVWDESKAKELKLRLSDCATKVVSGLEGMLTLATEPEAEMVLTAFVGMVGVEPTIAAILSGKHIALANKETLVTAGHIIMPLVKEKRVNLLPVDSEHSAIFQVLQGEKEAKPEKILLTASGGPFLNRTKEELKHVQPEDALQHPNWKMGAKITIDSATLANKGLEVIEAKWLFDVPWENIEVVIHPQSIIHSMVEFSDGAVLAQMGVPDMRLPIQYALTYPKRRPLVGERLSFFQIGQMTFAKPDNKTFKALDLAYQAGKEGGVYPTVFNAANELAVQKFLQGKISFLEIADFIEEKMKQYQGKYSDNPSLEVVLNVGKEIMYGQ